MYPGMSGKTQGDRNEITPAKNVAIIPIPEISIINRNFLLAHCKSID